MKLNLNRNLENWWNRDKIQKSWKLEEARRNLKNKGFVEGLKAFYAKYHRDAKNTKIDQTTVLACIQPLETS
jgi:hypothetical protein